MSAGIQRVNKKAANRIQSADGAALALYTVHAAHTTPRAIPKSESGPGQRESMRNGSDEP